MNNLFSRLSIFHVVKFEKNNVVFKVHGTKFILGLNILFNWMQYSVCFCLYFTSSISREKHQDILIATGYNNWKNISGMAKKHNSAESHKTSLAKYQGYISSKSIGIGAVTTQMNSRVEDNINKIIERVLVIPVSLASAERSFSTMKRIKTYLRTSMSTTRLHNLALISIERK